MEFSYQRMFESNYSVVLLSALNNRTTANIAERILIPRHAYIFGKNFSKSLPRKFLWFCCNHTYFLRCTTKRDVFLYKNRFSICVKWKRACCLNMEVCSSVHMYPFEFGMNSGKCHNSSAFNLPILATTHTSSLSSSFLASGANLAPPPSKRLFMMAAKYAFSYVIFLFPCSVISYLYGEVIISLWSATHT